ncbi:MAG: hypothetical protein AB2L12_00070 [Smithellaceae bacterium]
MRKKLDAPQVLNNHSILSGALMEKAQYVLNLLPGMLRSLCLCKLALSLLDREVQHYFIDLVAAVFMIINLS